MRRAADTESLGVQRVALAATAAMFLASAGLTGRLAMAHMTELAGLCGGAAASPHCGWCAATVFLALSGLAAAAALNRRWATVRVAAGRR